MKYKSSFHQNLVPLFNENGTFSPEYDPDDIQLTTPLRLMIYHSFKDIENSIKICNLLINSGADISDALKFYYELNHINNTDDNDIDDPIFKILLSSLLLI